MFFVLNNESQTSTEKMAYKYLAEFEVNVVELFLYIITTLSVVTAMVQMRAMKYKRKLGGRSNKFVLLFH